MSICGVSENVDLTLRTFRRVRSYEMCYSDGGPLLNQKDAVWVPIPAEVSVGVRREGAEREEKTP